MNTMDWKSGLITFFPGVVVGGALIMAVQTFTEREVAPIQAPVANAETKASDVTATTQSVSVIDQPAGRAVMIKQVTLDATSWIAVRDLNDGSVGNILGAVRRNAGTHSDVIVDLLRSTEPQKTYAVVLFTDNGDGTFNAKSDAPYMNGAEIFRVEFSATTPRSPGGR